MRSAFIFCILPERFLIFLVRIHLRFKVKTLDNPGGRGAGACAENLQRLFVSVRVKKQLSGGGGEERHRQRRRKGGPGRVLKVSDCST